MADMKKVLLGAQDVIDAALNVVSATQETQKILQANIDITDKKVGTHNVDVKSHEDIRLRLADMPAMLTAPAISGPSAVETGEENSWTFSSTPLISTAAVTSFDVTDQHGEVFTVEAGEDGRATFTHAFIGERNENIKMLVQAKGTHGFVSDIVEHPLLITKQLPPAFDTLAHTLPMIISHGKTYQFTINGITDPDNDLKTVSVACDTAGVTIAGGDNIIQGQQYTISVGADVKGPLDTNFTITATDNHGLLNTFKVPVRINGDPNVDNVITSIPKYLTANTNKQVMVTGATDSEDGDITFDIASSIPEITFSKNTNIALNEEFIVSVGNSSPATPYTITMTFKDKDGGSAIKTVESVINTPPNITGLKINQLEKHIPGKSSMISFTGATDANEEELKFFIDNKNTDLVFGKISDIALGEEVPLTIGVAIDRTKTYTVDVTVMDTSGGSASFIMTVLINTLPTGDAVEENIDPIIVPGRTYKWSFATMQDSDNDQLFYTVECAIEGVTISNANEIHAGEIFTVEFAGDDVITRGSQIPLKITVNDGKESVIYYKEVTVNTIPDSSQVQPEFPANIFGGEENGTDIILSGGSAMTAFTYSLRDAEGLMSFVPDSGIEENGTTKVIGTKVEESTSAGFDIVVVDSLGEESAPVHKTTTIDPIIVTKAPSIIYPTEGDEYVPHYEGFEMTWSEYESVAWTGEGVYPNNH